MVNFRLAALEGSERRARRPPMAHSRLVRSLHLVVKRTGLRPHPVSAFDPKRALALGATLVSCAYWGLKAQV